jgi:hypothetical protein
MKYLVATIAAVIFLPTVAGHADVTKKPRRPAYTLQRAPVDRVPVSPRYDRFLDPTRGNAAAAGNNANSMSGYNSAGENANGRTSGGGYGG